MTARAWRSRPHSGSCPRKKIGKQAGPARPTALAVLLVLLAWPVLWAPTSMASERLATASEKLSKAMQRKISLTFKGMATTEALNVLAEQTGISMAMSAGVKGNISLVMTDIDVATALDIITELTGNAYIAAGDIVRVVPEEEYIAETGSRFRTRLELGTLALQHIPATDLLVAATQLGLLTAAGKALPDVAANALVVWDVPETHARLRTLQAAIDRPPQTQRVVVPLQYAGTDSLVTLVRNHLTPGIGTVDLLGNNDRLAITDLPSRVDAIKDLITQLDVSARQVLMEVKILSVAYSDEKNIGINWEVVQDDLNDLGAKSVYPVLPRTTSGSITSGTVFTLGDLQDDEFTLLVEALENYGTTDIVSLPRILALDGQEAKIHVGSSEPYVTVTTRENDGIINYYETVTQVDVGVKLNITPTIHPNDFISMRVRPEVSSVARFATTAAGSSIPVVEQSTMETVVQVKSGVYVILGGLMKKEYRKKQSGIPILRGLPVLGYLFGSTTLSEVRSELVVMIRPTLAHGDAAVDSAGLH